MTRARATARPIPGARRVDGVCPGVLEAVFDTKDGGFIAGQPLAGRLFRTSYQWAFFCRAATNPVDPSFAFAGVCQRSPRGKIVPKLDRSSHDHRSRLCRGSDPLVARPRWHGEQDDLMFPATLIGTPAGLKLCSKLKWSPAGRSPPGFTASYFPAPDLIVKRPSRSEARDPSDLGLAGGTGGPKNRTSIPPLGRRLGSTIISFLASIIGADLR